MDLTTDRTARAADTSARLQVRLQARQLMRDPQDTQAHLARVEAALQMDGSEAVQGALADMFTQLDSHCSEVKRNAYSLCQHRLPARVALAFEALIAQNPLPQINTLATRWSLLSIPSADIPTRVRRCSLDDSKALAAQGVRAFEALDEPGQQAFLDHCMTCHDKMAFMLARRAVLKTAGRLPAAWETVSTQLEAL